MVTLRENNALYNKHRATAVCGRLRAVVYKFVVQVKATSRRLSSIKFTNRARAMPDAPHCQTQTRRFDGDIDMPRGSCSQEVVTRSAPRSLFCRRLDNIDEHTGASFGFDKGDFLARNIIRLMPLFAYLCVSPQMPYIQAFSHVHAFPFSA